MARPRKAVTRRTPPLGPLSLALLTGTPEQRDRLEEAEQARGDTERAFQAKFGRQLASDEQAAERGDVAAACRLITWAKRYLLSAPVAGLILHAEASGDRRTLEAVGRAVARMRKRRSPHQDFLDSLRALK